MSRKVARAVVPAEPGVLNAKQARFAAEYLVDLNAKQAAIRAGYSPRTAHAQGCRLLNDADVAAAIQAAMGARAERVQLESDEVLRQLRAIVRSNVRHFVIDDRGEVELAAGAPEDAFSAVSSVKHKIRSDEDGVTREVELKLWDKNAAIEKAMKHLGLLKDGAAGTINNTTNVVNVWRVAGREIRFR